MKEPCKAYEDALLAEDSATLAELGAHADSCPTCRETRDLWRRVDGIAPSLRKAWDSPGLLPRIRESAERSPRETMPPRLARAPGVWSRPLALAAILTLFAVATWISVRTPVPPQPGFGLPDLPRQGLISDESLREVEKTEAAYRASIEELERRARPRLENAPSPLLLSTREKLLVLDAAIAECRREIESNQLNTHLRRELLSMYVEKRKTLQSLFPENGDKS